MLRDLAERREALARPGGATTSAPSPRASTTTTPAAARARASGPAAAPRRSDSSASSPTAHLRQIIDGVDPATGERLRSHAKSRTITVERIDPETGERSTSEQTLDPVAGFDLVFSVPKSVSLLHALGERRTSASRSRARTSRLAGRARLPRGRGVRDPPRRAGRDLASAAAGFVAAAFQHRTSRAQDPHLHTHVDRREPRAEPRRRRVARARRRGRCSRQHRLAAGYLYQAHLRAELSRSLGVEWVEPLKGMAEIDGVPREVLVEFSQRRQQIVEHLEASGRSGFHAAQSAAIEPATARRTSTCTASSTMVGTRRGTRLRRRRARRDPRSRPSHRDPRRRTRPTLIAELVGDARPHREAHDVHASRRDHGDRPRLARRARDAPRRARPRRRAARRRRASTRLSESVPGTAGRYSTDRAPRARTRSARDRRARSHADAPTPVPRRQIREHATRVRHPAFRRASAYVRPAATSTRTRRLRRRRRRGRQDHRDNPPRPTPSPTPASRCSEPRRRERQRARSATRPASTPSPLHRLLADAERDGGLPHRAVVIVDEAGMADTRTLAPLLRHVERADAKLDPDRRPRTTPIRRRRRTLPRDHRARRRARAPREPPPTRPRTNAPRSRRSAAGDGHDYVDWADERATRRRAEPDRRANAPARRLVGTRPARPSRATS